LAYEVRTNVREPDHEANLWCDSLVALKRIRPGRGPALGLSLVSLDLSVWDFEPAAKSQTRGKPAESRGIARRPDDLEVVDLQVFCGQNGPMTTP
jgi:hypothetical protein